MRKIIIVLIPILLLTGCYDYRELSDLAIITAISIDKVDDNLKIAIQVVNPKKEQDTTSTNEPDFVTYTSSAKTVQEALRKVVNDSPAKLYGSHMEILIISEKVAENHLNEILDFFSRDPEPRSEMNIFIAKNSDPKDELSIITPLINLPSTKILSSLEANVRYLGTSQDISLNYVIDCYLNPYKELTLPTLEIKGDVNKGEEKDNTSSGQSDTSIILSNIGIFKDNKFITYLNDTESQGVNFILDNINSTIVKYKCSNDEYLVSEILKSNTSLEADLEKNIVKINLEGHATISELTCDIDIKDTNVVKQVKQDIDKAIENIVKDTFYNIRDKYNTDIFNFRDLYYKTDYKYFKENYQDNWYSEVFPNLEIEVNANYKLYEKGSTLGGINYEQK